MEPATGGPAWTVDPADDPPVSPAAVQQWASGLTVPGRPPPPPLPLADAVAASIRIADLSHGQLGPAGEPWHHTSGLAGGFVPAGGGRYTYGGTSVPLPVAAVVAVGCTLAWAWGVRLIWRETDDAAAVMAASVAVAVAPPGRP